MKQTIKSLSQSSGDGCMVVDFHRLRALFVGRRRQSVSVDSFLPWYWLLADLTLIASQF